MWDRFRSPKSVQCRWCWRYGHTGPNCGYDFRCGRCDQKHAPGSCLRKTDSEAPPYCCVCGEWGHPASYGGCKSAPHPRSELFGRSPPKETPAPTASKPKPAATTTSSQPKKTWKTQPTETDFMKDFVELSEAVGCDIITFARRARSFAPELKKAKTATEKMAKYMEFFGTL